MSRHTIRGHALLVGMTTSGKTICARRIAAAYLAKGISVLVHDKFAADWGQHRYQWHPGGEIKPLCLVTEDDQEFLWWVANARGCAVFVDEAPELCSNTKRGEPFQKLATQGRHLGHRCHFIAQGPKQIAHQIRANCTDIFAFNLKAPEALKLYQETGEQWALDTRVLPKGYFYFAAPFEPTRLQRLFK